VVKFTAVLLMLCAGAARAEAIEWPWYQDQALALLQCCLRIDTQNPPVNEARAAAFVHELFEVPGRANIIANIKGDGSSRPQILLNHLDTVRADSTQWKVPPLSAEIVDGELYGRGALDMKSLGMLQAMILVILARERVPLHRDVIFLGTADEEVD
jgi:acetylornithine deacetylase/succinyl-diaminopimelate desuccinylase-like protein